MTKTHWKFELNTDSIQLVKMPRNSKILTVQVQDDRPVMWAFLTPDAPLENRCIESFFNGEPVDIENTIEREYIGTYQLKGLVYHVYLRWS